MLKFKSRHCHVWCIEREAAGPVITDVVVALAHTGWRWGIPRSSGVTTWACNRGEHEREVCRGEAVSQSVTMCQMCHLVGRVFFLKGTDLLVFPQCCCFSWNWVLRSTWQRPSASNPSSSSWSYRSCLKEGKHNKMSDRTRRWVYLEPGRDPAVRPADTRCRCSNSARTSAGTAGASWPSRG